jgi:hypothetical protein
MVVKAVDNRGNSTSVTNVTIFPNPAKSYLRIVDPGNLKTVSVTIYNEIGQRVYYCEKFDLSTKLNIYKHRIVYKSWCVSFLTGVSFFIFEVLSIQTYGQERVSEKQSITSRHSRQNSTTGN